MITKFFGIYEDEGFEKALSIEFSNKKTQQKTINKIIRDLEHYRRVIETI